MSETVKKIGKTDEYVYDISLDGTVLCADNGMVLSNTDGMNMLCPPSFTYTPENPYIGKGLGRNCKKDVAYEEGWGDVMEFEDLYMRGKMGLDIDEVIENGSINLSRKNYIDFLNEKETKMVGNTVKSKTMPVYIEKFIEEAVPTFRSGNGKQFLDIYYRYVDEIYNMRIPVKDICSKGKIKTTMEEYKERCKEMTKSGSRKARQVWYELAIREGIKCDIGSTVYYVNNGKSKNDRDTDKVTKYYLHNGDDLVDVTKIVNKLFTAFKKNAKSIYAKTVVNINFYLWFIGTMKPTKYDTDFDKRKKDYNDYVKACHSLIPFFEEEKKKFREQVGKGEITYDEDVTLNCQLIPAELIESEDPTAMDGYQIEYNADKYLEALNKKMVSFLVCFKPEIRFKDFINRKGEHVLVDNIIITNPQDAPYFTEEQCALDCGHPLKPGDQDSYEELMSMDRREIEFWIRNNKIPPFYEEIGMDWEGIKEKYRNDMIAEDNELYKTLNEQYISIIETLTKKEVEEMYETAEIPQRLRNLVFVKNGIDDTHFYFIEMPDLRPSTGGYIFEDISVEEEEDDDSEEEMD